VHAGGLLSDEIIALIDGMLGPSDSVRDANITAVCKLDDTEQADALDLLFTQGRQFEDANAMFVASIRWARGNPAIASPVVQAIRDTWSRLTPAAVAELSGSGVSELTALVRDILADTNLPGEVAEAARIELEQ
jgi:hypothetical protein